MAGAIAIFVKTPGISPVKTRLAKDIGKEKAEAFFCFSAYKTRDAVNHALLESEHDFVPYWAIGEQEGLAHPLWKDFNRMHSGEGELGQRLHHVYSMLMQQYEYVILLGADSPDISSALILQAIRALHLSRDYVIGPTFDGGFYLFGGNNPIDKEIWLDTPYSSDHTLCILQDYLIEKNNILYVSPLLDIDDGETLSMLRIYK